MSPTPEPVSVIMPVLNEEEHLAASVRGVLGQDYAGTIDLVLAVGPSDDRTQEIADRLAREDPRVRVIDNPSGTTPEGLNLAVGASLFDIIVRVDAHVEMPPDYIRTAVEVLRRTGAANVGGRMEARGRTPFEQAVAVAYMSRIGLGGGGFHMADTPEGPAETVFLGAFRRDALERVGGFDPTLRRAQDWDLNFRLRSMGETVWFTPVLRVTYRPRSTVGALARQFFTTGQWRREVMRRRPETASARYLAPPVAVVLTAAGVLAGVGGALGGPRGLSLGWALPVAYAAGVTVAALSLHRDMPSEVRVRLPLVLAVMHMSWGSGFLVGLPARLRGTPMGPPGGQRLVAVRTGRGPARGRPPGRHPRC